MRKLIGSLTVIAALASAGPAFACSMHQQSASSDQQTVASAAANETPATTTTTTPKTPEASIGG
jgi:hypothetical protein